MISKKSRKVVAALLIGATVCASGTFAYFNAKTDLNDIAGYDTSTAKTLNITNGYIEIKGRIKGTTTTQTSALWAYDVARVSTITEMMTNNGFASIMNTNYKLPTDITLASGMVMSDDYIDKNESPDILGLTDDQNVVKLQALMDAAKEDLDKNDGDPSLTAAYNSAKSNYENAKKALRTSNSGRASVGTGVSGTIVKARPGDAFVLGASNSNDVLNSGIEIVNNSNLTTKIGIGLNSANKDEVKKQLKAMNANGWKVYIKVSGVDATANNPYNEWTAIDSDFVDGTTDTICQVASVAPGSANPVLQMRVELPLLTKNEQQKKKTGEGIDEIDEFDIKDMFEIVATQENNPGWNENGTATRPTTASPVTP